MKSEQKFLYIGLALLLFAFIVRSIGLPLYCFWTLLGIAITFKTIFLIKVFRKKGFKPDLWLYFILVGVALMLLSLLFKNIIPNIVLNRILFFSAIALKTTGLILLFYKKSFK